MPADRPSRPNVLLVTIDTLRADRLGCYGAATRPSPSPWIDALAARGVLFEQAVASAPETAPAVASLLTGLYQDRHEAPWNRSSLPYLKRTLAEALRDAGYATAAFVGNRLVDRSYEFTQGFDHEEVVAMEPVGGAPASDDRLVARAGLWLAAAPKDRPWFTWVHLMDPHGPYNSAPTWWSRGLEYPAPSAALDLEPPVSDSNFGLGILPAYQRMDGVRRLGDYVRRYDGEVAFSDAQVGALLGHVAATGRGGDTVVVLTADHGESLVEHGELLQHGWFVHDTTVRVPLIVAGPRVGGGGRRVEAQVCSVDVMPTVLELAGADPEADLDGVSFAAGVRGAVASEGRACFSVGARANHPFALRDKGMKMIVTPAGAPTDPRAPKGERSEEPEKALLFDLRADPGETVDVSAARADVAGDLAQKIAGMRARFRSSGLRW